jgi:hypothetical protein
MPQPPLATLLVSIVVEEHFEQRSGSISYYWKIQDWNISLKHQSLKEEERNKQYIWQSIHRIKVNHVKMKLFLWSYFENLERVLINQVGWMTLFMWLKFQNRWHL